MKKAIAILIFGLFSNLVSGQIPFTKLYGKEDFDAFVKIKENRDGQLLTSKYSESQLFEGISYLTVLSYQGDSILSYINNDSVLQINNFVQIINSKYIINIGFYNKVTDYDFLIQKIDTSGNEIWIKHYGGIKNDFATDLEPTIDSGFILVGINRSNSNNISHVYIVRTDKNGDSLWTRNIGDSYGQEAYGIEKLNDSTFIVAGTWGNVLNGSADAFAMKINLDGDTSDLRLYGNAYQNFGNSLCKLSDGGFAIAGWSTYDFVVHEQMVLYKLDSNLNLLWTKYYGDLYTDETFDIKQTYDKGYILVGYSEQTGRGEDVYVVRTDSMGDTLWTKTLGGIDDERAYSVVQTPDSGFAIVGQTYSFGAGGSDAFFLKLKPNGDITTSIGLPVEPKKEEIQVYPNPAINSISIELAQNTDVSSIRIADNLGKIVKEIRINRTIQSEIIPIDDLSDGIYFIQIQTNDGSILSKKFSKLH